MRVEELWNSEKERRLETMNLLFYFTPLSTYDQVVYYGIDLILAGIMVGFGLGTVLLWALGLIK